MIRRLLIANRGEIARRIARTCQRLGMPFVVVYSDADRDALHLAGAAATVAIGPAPAALSYLNGPALIRAALETGCDAVHPGYGFLSEHAEFAAAVESAGLVFIGPAPETIAQMGDKAAAKAIMAKAGVPVVPGSLEATENPAAILRLVAEVGHPALLKPVAGGGGKGMAVVESGDGRDAVESAIRTAKASFGDGRLLVERLIERPRHVEVQIFGDGRGGVVHLFERECSLQRRHQKVVEEAPAANLPAELRGKLIAAAVRGAEALRYRNAGTFEFIVAPDGSFYFLEVNTRLQVEHPVTEAITGIDLVEWQLLVAGGAPIPLPQREILPRGHAIECRIYAEDPSAGFRPAPGRVARVRWPQGTRIESAVEDGSGVPSHYDPMIAKMIVHAGDRTLALENMRVAVGGAAIVGLTTNLGFLARLLARPEVAAATADTRFIDTVLPELLPEAYDQRVHVAAAAAIVLASGAADGRPRSPWSVGSLAGMADRPLLDRDAPLGRLSLSAGGGWSDIAVKAVGAGGVTVAATGEGIGSRVHHVTGRATLNFAEGEVEGQRWHAMVGPRAVDLTLAGTRTVVERAGADVFEAGAGGDTVIADMPGLVTKVNAAAGSAVSKGDVLVIVEAMKFENPVAAARDGIVAEVACHEGDQVKAGQVLVAFKPARLADDTLRSGGKHPAAAAHSKSR